MEARQRGAIGRFFHGASFFGKGLGFVLGHAQLWGWVLGPSLLTLLIASAGVATFWSWGKAFVEAHTAGHGAFVAWLLESVLFLLALLVGYLAFLVTSLIAAAPFVGTLSERTEKLVTGQEVTPRGLRNILSEALRTLGHTMLALSLYVTLSAALLLLQFLVVPLAPFVWIASFFLTALFFAYDAWDLPLSRRGASFGKKWQVLNQHRAESLGFGAAVALLLAIPGFGLVVPAVAAVGGTLLFLDSELT